MDVDALVNNLEAETFEVLDFEDENIAVSVSLPNTEESLLSKRRSRTSYQDHGMGDEGELKSDEDSGLDGDNSSEEGEVQSEIDEMEAIAEQSPVRNETPWERGLRLAREKLEKVKALKATEKDIAEKRMTLAVTAPVVDEECKRSSREDVFWLCYYQTSIVGRTELTCRRFLAEDLQPPSATELAEWRLSLSGDRRGRRRRRYRRGSSASPSSSDSSSRASSFDSASVASSLGSVAASWKATCARAMKDYLSSPIRNKDRRGRHRSMSSVSSDSGSDSGSSDSLSGSDRSEGHRTGYRSIHSGRTSKAALRDGRRHWPDSKGRSRSGSGPSSASRSGSRSSGDSSPHRESYPDWRYGSRKVARNEDQQERESPAHSDSHSPNSRRRAEVPLLPHERPVKRPWVAAPGLVAPVAPAPVDVAKGLRANSSDQSRQSSPSGSPGPDERRFITSWSKSPSSGDESQIRRPARRERLPDVVPGRVRNPATPSIRHRVPTPIDHRLPVEPQSFEVYDELSEQPLAKTMVDEPPLTSQPEEVIPQHSHVRPDSVQDPAAAQSSQAITTVGGGELPSNRPEVRMTLAPRLKASTVDMTNIPGGVTRPSGGRTNQPSPPPRIPRIPFPPSSGLPHGHSTITTPGPLGSVLDQSEIRRQAEAAAAIVEARERRRAAAEAARRRNNPVQKKKKREDLSKIPVRGRPTYRRLSFSDSDASIGSSSASKSGSPQTSVDSRSPSGTPSPNVIVEPEYMTPPVISHHRKRHKNEVAPPPIMYDEMPDMVAQYGRQIPRNLPDYGVDAYQTFERKKHSAKLSADTTLKYRGERQSRMTGEFQQKVYNTSYMKNVHDDYGMIENPAHHPSMSRRRESKPDQTSAMRYPTQYEEQIGRYDHAGGSRRVIDHRRAAVPAPSVYNTESGQQPHVVPHRQARPRTPHADVSFGDAFGVRSPRSSATTAGLMPRPHKADRKRALDRVEFNVYDTHLQQPSRKRAMVAEPEQQFDPNLELKRAHSRHRSRGPGMPIDRSEPFESDSSAAEQRLRELRERLNRVDDAIAEIKAGSNHGGYYDSRR